MLKFFMKKNNLHDQNKTNTICFVTYILALTK